MYIVCALVNKKTTVNTIYKPPHSKGYPNTVGHMPHSQPVLIRNSEISILLTKGFVLARKDRIAKERAVTHDFGVQIDGHTITAGVGSDWENFGQKSMGPWEEKNIPLSPIVPMLDTPLSAPALVPVVLSDGMLPANVAGV